MNPQFLRLQRNDHSSDDLLDCYQLEHTNVTRFSLPAITSTNSPSKPKKNYFEAEEIDIQKQKDAKIERYFFKINSSDDIQQLRDNST